MFQSKVVENIKTQISCSIMFFFFENRTVYEIMLKNFVEPDKPQMTKWHMRVARWIPRATSTHAEWAILIAFPRQQWLQERASILRYTKYDTCLVFSQIHLEYTVGTLRMGRT